MSIDLRSKSEKIPISEVPAWLCEHGFPLYSMSSVWMWVRAGKLRSAKVGKRRYTDADALQEMADRQVTAARPPKQKRKRYGRQARLEEADAFADATLRRMGLLK